MSRKRAGFAATIVGVMALFFLMMRERLKTREQLRRALLVGVAVAIGLLAGGQMIRKISSFEQADTANRLIIWRTAAKAIGDSPWWGWGLGSFSDIYAVYQPKEIVQPNKAHSTPIETVVELGIPGAIAAWLVVLIPWATCSRGGGRRRRHHRYRRPRPLRSQPSQFCIPSSIAACRSRRWASSSALFSVWVGPKRFRGRRRHVGPLPLRQRINYIHRQCR